MAKRSPQQEAIRKRSNAIVNPVQGNKDKDYTFDKKDAGFYHVKYVPLRVTQVLNNKRVTELTDAARVQKHSVEMYEELEYRGHFDKRDVRAIVLHDPTAEAELTPQQKAAITRKQNEEAKAKEDTEKAKEQDPSQ